MSPLRVLIVGGGIAGPVAAFFLSKDGAADVTIVERASSLRTAGQNIDIRGTAADVIRAMGLEEEIRAKHSTEEGVSWVDAQNRSFVDFAANQSQRSFTADIEIVRSQLCRILYDATKDKVKYVFGEYVTAINQVGSDNGKAQVTLAKGGLQEYDIVIAADGLASKTRALMFPEDNTKDWVKPTGLYMSFFTIPKGETDTTWRRWYVASGSRGIMVRPDDTGTTRALLGTMAPDPRLEEVLRKPISEQRALLRDIFAGAGWETERILAGMDESSDFYMAS
ncbi:hypothetical protein MMC10_002657 [Thelotrema lepadinum]|nr:hypothetical protein [Thelotrema lepadinum]